MVEATAAVQTAEAAGEKKRGGALFTGAGIYLNYIAYGMQVILISQNKDMFMQRWNTDSAGIMTVIAWTGLAKTVSVWIAGEVSDKIGRKPLILASMVGYILFFAGMLMSTDIVTASILAFLVGVANSMMDGASYPALQENFTKAPGSALVAVKGFISISQMLFPLLVGFLLMRGAWYGWAIVIPMALFILNLPVVLGSTYSYDTELRKKKAAASEIASAGGSATPVKEVTPATNFVTQPKFWVEGICCLVFGCTSLITFYLISQVLTMYGKDYIGMSDMSSRFLMTLYTAGSLAAVLLSTFAMAKGVKTIAVLLVFTAGSFISLAALALFPTPLVAYLSSVGIGFFAAGGALQAGIAVMGDFFPGNKGRNVGIYYTFMALGSYAGPVAASRLMAIDFRLVMYFDAIVAAVGFLLVLIAAARFKKVFGTRIFSKK